MMVEAVSSEGREKKAHRSGKSDDADSRHKKYLLERLSK